MAKKSEKYERLTPELKKELAGYVVTTLREEEAKQIKVRHDKKRANIKLVLRRYRELVAHVEEAVYEATQAEDDYSLQSILELMGCHSGKVFSIDNMRENVATVRLLVVHMERMLDQWRLLCEHSGKEEEMRRYRVVTMMYIDPKPTPIEEIANFEHIDKRTVYRDIDAAIDKLAVLFFGMYGLDFL